MLTEVAVRPPGDSIMALHWLATGAPLEDTLVGLAVGEDVAPPPRPRRYARQVYLDTGPACSPGCRSSRRRSEVTWFDRSDVHEPIRETGAADDPPAVRCVAGPQAARQHGSDRCASPPTGWRMFVVDAASPEALDQIEARSPVTCT